MRMYLNTIITLEESSPNFYKVSEKKIIFAFDDMDINDFIPNYCNTRELKVFATSTQDEWDSALNSNYQQIIVYPEFGSSFYMAVRIDPDQVGYLIDMVLENVQSWDFA